MASRVRMEWFVCRVLTDACGRFDRVILLVIVVNSLVLAIADYSLSSVNPSTLEPDPSQSWRNAIVSASEVYFTSIFTAEAVLKIVSMGFVMDAGSYLQDHWNWYDASNTRRACRIVTATPSD